MRYLLNLRKYTWCWIGAGVDGLRVASAAHVRMRAGLLPVRAKSHRKSSRWFLPFSVFHRSIAVGCELSLHPKMRTYKNEVHHEHFGIKNLALGSLSTLAVVETLLNPRTEGFSGPPSPLGM